MSSIFNQSPLFTGPEGPERIQNAGADVFYIENFLSSEEATTLFQLLLKNCPWERHQAAFGHSVPRAEAYYGDPGTTYTYSRREYKPLAWLPELLTLKLRVEQATPADARDRHGRSFPGYNAVLCNLYRDGNDSVSLHADNEPVMSDVIASVSLGAPRLFRIRRNGGGWIFQKRLAHGSLLIMAGETQRFCGHEVPKEPGVTDPRINLTFRQILTEKPVE
jgi:alkylated DNA repair dioxygenase AlkB